MSVFNDLLFELSSDQRLEILRHLRSYPATMTSIAKEIQITNQECSRHLIRLSGVGLITKNQGNSFTLTPYGNQVLALLRGLEFTSKYNKYFREHTLDRIPLTFIYRIGELANCTFIDDVMVVFRNMEQMINDSEEYLLRVTDRYSLITMHAVERAYQRGVWQHLLDPEDIVVPPDFDNGPIYQGALKNGQFIDYTLPRVDLFLTMSEKEVSVLAFPTINGRFDYTGFASKDPSFHRWCKELFEHYWSKGKPKPLDWLQKKILESKKKAQV